jgi:hypothetical protein
MRQTRLPTGPIVSLLPSFALSFPVGGQEKQKKNGAAVEFRHPC